VSCEKKQDTFEWRVESPFYRNFMTSSWSAEEIPGLGLLMIRRFKHSGNPSVWSSEDIVRLVRIIHTLSLGPLSWADQVWASGPN
jgi:hypothetical protein